MQQVEAEVDRYLTLLGNKIRGRGFTQVEIQDALGWGRSYISQLVTKAKALRVEQVLLILNIIGVDPAEFFAELYGHPEAPHAAASPDQAPTYPGHAEAQQRELRGLQAQLQAMVGHLLEKKLITSRDLRAAVAAADREPRASG